MHRKMQFGQRPQQIFDRIGQDDRAGGVGQQAGAGDQRTDAHRQQNGVPHALGVDMEHPETDQRFPLPRDKNRLSTAVKMMMGTMGLRLRKIILPGICAIRYKAASSTSERASPSGLAATNSTTM